MKPFDWIRAQKPILLAHRAGSAIEEENSLAALRTSAALGIEAVELDVHELADGTFLVYHHWRLPGDKLWVADMTSDRCKEMLGPRYLELHEVFAEAKPLGLGIYLDIKGMTLAGQQRLWKLIDSDFDRRSIVILSFQGDIAVRAAEAGVLAAIPYRDRWMDPIRMAQTPVAFLQPVLDDGYGFEACTSQYVERIHQQGKQVISWVSNKAEEIALFHDLGCDVIMSDDPRLLLEILRKE